MQDATYQTGCGRPSMATFEELKRKGNEHFKEGHFKLASEFYKALELSPSNHLVLSNRNTREEYSISLFMRFILRFLYSCIYILPVVPRFHGS